MDGIVVDDVFSAVLAVENRDRDTPGTLSGNAPVAAVTDHAGDTVLAPVRNPFHALDRFNGLLLELVNRAEPLLSRAKNHRILAAPAVRILVDDLLNCQKISAVLQRLRNGFVGVVCGQSRKRTGVFGQLALAVHGNNDRKLFIVLHTDFKVFDTVSGCGVDTSGAAFKGDVVAENYQ